MKLIKELIEEQKLRDRGRYRDERGLHFTRGEVLLFIQFAGSRREDLGWDYALGIAYPSNWKEKCLIVILSIYFINQIFTITTQPLIIDE
jgi:hypothetical protein